MPQRGTGNRGDRGCRRHPRYHADGYVRPARLRRDLGDGSRHGEHTRVTGGHDGHAGTPGGEVEREFCALCLYTVVAGMHPLPRPRRDAREIGSIADKVSCGGQFGAHLRRCLRRGPRPEADHHDFAGPELRRIETRIVASARHDDHREVRDVRRIDLADGQDTLCRG